MKNTKKKARTILSRNLKRLREEMEFTQEELAFRSGLHRTYISSVERVERNISIDGLEKIAEAFNIPIKKLLEESNETP